MAKQKIHSTTQNFTEIEDIMGDTVFIRGHNACSLMEVSSVNFFLLSADEQNARIYGYMSLLNSLSFPIQILIMSKKIDLTSYVALLDQKINSVQNLKIKEHLQLYQQFIQELIKGAGLLDKKIYVVIPFSSLELGGIPLVQTNNGGDSRERVINALASKRETVLGQIERMGLTARILQAEELTRVFYEIFNQESAPIDFSSQDVKNIIL